MNDPEYAATWNGEDMPMREETETLAVPPKMTTTSSLGMYGKILYVDVLDFRKMAFTLGIMTDTCRLRTRIQLDRANIAEYYPWSCDWEHHLKFGLHGMEVISHEPHPGDYYGADLADKVRRMRLSESADQEETPEELARLITEDPYHDSKPTVKKYGTKPGRSFLASSNAGTGPFDGNGLFHYP